MIWISWVTRLYLSSAKPLKIFLLLVCFLVALHHGSYAEEAKKEVIFGADILSGDEAIQFFTNRSIKLTEVTSGDVIKVQFRETVAILDTAAFSGLEHYLIIRNKTLLCFYPRQTGNGMKACFTVARQKMTKELYFGDMQSNRAYLVTAIDGMPL